MAIGLFGCNVYNASRSKTYGRTTVDWRASIEGTDITENQLQVWMQMRSALETLPIPMRIPIRHKL